MPWNPRRKPRPKQPRVDYGPNWSHESPSAQATSGRNGRRRTQADGDKPRRHHQHEDRRDVDADRAMWMNLIGTPMRLAQPCWCTTHEVSADTKYSAPARASSLTFSEP